MCSCIRHKKTQNHIANFFFFKGFCNNSDLAYKLFVPCLVGRCPSADVVYNVDYKKDNKENRTNDQPHNLPVPAGAMTKHVFYVFFKPKTRK